MSVSTDVCSFAVNHILCFKMCDRDWVLGTADDVDIQFARSGGAGGQNVNKVNTKVDMRLKLDVSWLSEEIRAVLQRQASVHEPNGFAPRCTFK